MACQTLKKYKIWQPCRVQNMPFKELARQDKHPSKDGDASWIPERKDSTWCQAKERASKVLRSIPPNHCNFFNEQYAMEESTFALFVGRK